MLLSNQVSNRVIYSFLFFRNVRSAAAVCARRGIYRVIWCFEPMKLFSCLSFLVGFIFYLLLIQNHSYFLNEWFCIPAVNVIS